MSTSVKFWKAFDFIGQVLTVAVPLIWGICTSQVSLIASGILLALGVWQIISFIIHLAIRRAPWMASGRRGYGYTLLILALMGLGSFIEKDLSVVFFLVLLIAGPILGIIYLATSYTEWQRAKAMSLRGRQAL